ncbi:MAG: flagellar basal body P-ring formation chaperone FlgA [Desulfovibrio sp.]|uniref:flagellar basal body P-ring formation chaperone FlgA n=1 Tax=Desulfovibrio sp. 7SRBS1 TaxID=3378064 RepID=UPI003B425CBE
MTWYRGFGTWFGLMVLLLLPTLGVAQNGGKTWAVVTKRAACAAGENVLLGEIAQPFGHVPDGVWRRMAQTELWKAPSPGSRPITYSVHDLQSLLQKSLGSGAKAVRISGQLSLQRGGRVIDAEEIERRTVDYLTPRLAAGGGEVTLRNITTPNFVFLDKDFHSMAIEQQTGDDAGRVTLRFAAKTIDGRILRRFAVSLFVDRWINVPSVMRPVNPGDILTPDLITFERKNAAYLSGKVWDGQGGPWVVKQPIGRGMVIYRDNLRVQPLVMKGDRLELVYKSKHVQLSTDVEAMEDGGQGDAILVRNLQSKREIRAKVWDKRTVMIRR